MGMSVKTIESVIANGGKLIDTGKTNGVQVFKTMLKDGGYQLDSFTKSGQPFKEIVKKNYDNITSHSGGVTITRSHELQQGKIEDTSWKNFLTNEMGGIKKFTSTGLNKKTIFEATKIKKLEVGQIKEVISIANKRSLLERLLKKPFNKQAEYYYEYKDGRTLDSWHKDRLMMRVEEQRRKYPQISVGLYRGHHGCYYADIKSPYVENTSLEGYKQLVKKDSLEKMPRTIDDIYVLLNKLI